MKEPPCDHRGDVVTLLVDGHPARGAEMCRELSASSCALGDPPLLGVVLCGFGPVGCCERCGAWLCEAHLPRES